MSANRVAVTPTPEAQLRSFIQKFDPKLQKLFRSMRTAVRKLFPTATELAYDYSSSVVIGFSPTDRGIESIVALSLRTDGVRLYFNQAKQLPDPKKLLLGSGKQARYIRIESARQLSTPDIKAMITASVQQASIPMPSKGKGGLVIRSKK